MNLRHDDAEVSIPSDGPLREFEQWAKRKYKDAVAAQAAQCGMALQVGVLWLRSKKPTYFVVLHSASGETKALSDVDGAFVDRVVGAVNQAIVERG